MPRGLSLHIGVNFLSTKFYSTNGKLRCPQNDARAMAGLALMEGFENPRLLLNENATKSNFLNHFDGIIPELDAGDTFLLSFSGHGGQIKDENADEVDGKDETWCFYDEHLIDDEIGERWKAFKTGVKIIVVSSSCNSGTALKVWDKSCFPGGPFSPGACQKDVDINASTVLSSHIHDPEIKAGILHLSACEDKQKACAGDHFSSFTSLLLEHWDYGRFTGNYEQLVSGIQKRTGYLQRPGLRTLGTNNPLLVRQTAFKLS